MDHKHDPSLDYLRYPTFAPLPRQVARCGSCGGSAFEFLLPQWKPVCRRCGMELKLPHIVTAPCIPTKHPGIQFCQGFCHMVFLRPDGTVRAVGANFDGRCDVQDWTGIQAIAAGQHYTVGLCTDGTVKAVGRNDSDVCNVQSWSGIRAIAAGHYHTVGLCSDGTVKSVGENLCGSCNVQSWSNVTHIWATEDFTAARTADGTFLSTNPTVQRLLREVPSGRTEIEFCTGFCHTAILRPDGTVRTVGSSTDGQCNVLDWTGIRAIAAGHFHTVGLCSDGTVKAVGRNSSGQCNVQDWSNVCAIAAGHYHTVGLCTDGTVKAVGANHVGSCDVQSWSNVTHIWAGADFIAAITADGTFLCTDPEIQELFREALA